MRRLTLLAALVCLAAPPALADPTVAPYLQAGTPDAMTVLWQSGAPVTPRLVLQDAAGREIVTATGPAGRAHAIKLTGLKPGTRYRYVAHEGARVVGAGHFRTNPGPEVSRLRFAVLGDTGSGNANQLAVAKALAAWKPDFVLHTGDVVYERGEAENYPSRFFGPYRALLGNTVFYPSLGNHDYVTRQAAPYFAFFEAPRRDPRETEQWYTFRAGRAQFFALDSNAAFGPGSPQTTWLEGQLAASRADWKIAFFHHPPYTSGPHGSSFALRQAWGPLFDAHDVQLVFNGHDHHYERVRPQEAEDGRPTTYVVTGGGGAWLRRVHPQSFTAKAESAYHFVGVTVEGDRLTAQAIAPDGRVIDRFVLSR